CTDGSSSESFVCVHNETLSPDSAGAPSSAAFSPQTTTSAATTAASSGGSTPGFTTWTTTTTPFFDPLVRDDGACMKYGNSFRQDIRTASESCCACGGGQIPEQNQFYEEHYKQAALKIYLPLFLKEPASQSLLTQYKFTVSWNHREPQGFQPTRFAAQLTDEYDENPSFVYTTGAFVYQKYDATLLKSVTAVVMNQGMSQSFSGLTVANPKRFTSMKDNFFYLR
ncbi:unnamed protein product, partial [Amoebophrya sp. A120]